MNTTPNVPGRYELTVICTTLKSGRALHFCGHPVLSGANHDLWFPLGEADDLFQAIERLMVTNHQAVNVTRVETLAGFACCEDLRVTYNAPVDTLRY
ncbi:hypothetical protein KX75_20485 [Salmonella enterica subsp. enterica]|nr:hypothetical protein [Salmonella enterica subsp. enterica serovar Mikawasima]EDN7229245.1 hypothetical protein [Salmonella enterica subsp. enterica serovar Mikawasima]